MPMTRSTSSWAFVWAAGFINMARKNVNKIETACKIGLVLFARTYILEPYHIGTGYEPMKVSPIVLGETRRERTCIHGAAKTFDELFLVITVVLFGDIP